MSEFNRDGSASTQKLLDRITELEATIKHYMLCHDRYGGDDLKTGRAWDSMRKALEKDDD